MKNKTLNKIIACILLSAMFITLVPIYSIESSAETFTKQNILQVNASSSSKYISGSWYSITKGSGNIKQHGCGLVSLVSAVYNLGGTIQKDNIGSVISEICDWAYSKGYWSNNGTNWSFFAASDEAFGSKYGFNILETNNTYGCYGSPSSSVSLDSLVEHIKSGRGTAVVHVYAHYMAIVDYKVEKGKEMLLLFDPSPGIGTYYNSKNRRDITKAEGSWFELSVLKWDGGTKGDAGSTENIEIDGYWLVAPSDSTGPNPDDYTFPTRELYYNSPLMTGNDVGWVQAFLCQMGYTVDVDLKYGPDTSAKVKAFQQDNGLTVDGCVGSGTREKMKELWEKKQHSECTWDSGKITAPPLHTLTGTMTYTCTVCGKTKTESIPKTTDHTFGPWTNSDSVKHSRSCACGVYEAMNHSWDNGEVTVAPTYTSNGEKLFTCLECNTTKTEIISKLEQDHIAGDINGDGIVNQNDTRLLMEYIAGLNVSVNKSALDINGDGLVNNKDVSRLMQYLAGWNVTIYQ